MKERAGEQKEKREVSKQMHPVLANEEVDQHRSEAGNGEPSEEAARVGVLGHVQ